MNDTVIGKQFDDLFWGRVRAALMALRPKRLGDGPTYGNAAIARSIGMRPKLGARIEEALRQGWDDAANRNVSLSLLVIEIDCAREYFAAYGKGATDECLHEVMRAITNALPREGDMCLRLGQAGFVAVLPDLPALLARRTAEQLTNEVRKLGLAHRESHVGLVTVSTGLAVTNPHGSYDRKFFEAGAAAVRKAQRKGLARLEVVDLRPAQERRRQAA